MTDSNGYNDSLLPTEEGTCFVCRNVLETVRHEVFYGTANRENSKREGMWVNVCVACHRNIHANPEQYLMLKEVAQKTFEVWRPRAEFMQIFGRNYIDD